MKTLYCVLNLKYSNACSGISALVPPVRCFNCSNADVLPWRSRPPPHTRALFQTSLDIFVKFLKTVLLGLF